MFSTCPRDNAKTVFSVAVAMILYLLCVALLTRAEISSSTTASWGTAMRFATIADTEETGILDFRNRLRDHRRYPADDHIQSSLIRKGMTG
jgi:hypothetical protein